MLLQAAPEPPRARLSAQAVAPAERLGVQSSLAALRAHPRSFGALAAILMASVGLLAANVFLPLRLSDLGAPPSLIALSATASALFEIPVMLMGRQLTERLGLRGFFVVGCLIYTPLTPKYENWRGGLCGNCL